MIKYRDEIPERMIKFLNYQSNVKNKSDLTINEYCTDLKLFLRYVYAYKNKLPYSDINDIDITVLKDDFFNTVSLDDTYQFLSYCKDIRKNKEKARARKVSSIRTFFKYLKLNGVIEDNPMVNLDSPKLKKSLPKYLNFEQAKKLLSVIDGPYRERDYCIITLFLNCGLRLAELVSINYNEINISEDTATIVITGKGNKERVIYLNNACIAAINSYMRVRPKDGVKDKYALFLSNRLSRISPKTVQHMVDVYLEKAGLGGLGFSVHKLRHTAATLMYQTGQVDVLELKEILGHENLNTTQIYTHLLSEQLANAVAANPLANITKQNKPIDETDD